MQSPEARERADRLFALHDGKRPLVLLHAWDAGSARVFEQTGAPAVATTSAGITWSLGVAGGEASAGVEFVAACSRICRAVSVPVIVEIPAWIVTKDETCDVVRQLTMIGVSGLTIREYSSASADRIASIRSLARELRARLFLNARIDASGHQTLLERARQCIDAGADGITVPASSGYDAVRLARAVNVPVSFDVGDDWGPSPYGLAFAGIRRISLEQTAFKSSVGLLQQIAANVLSGSGLHNSTSSHHGP